MKPVSAASGVRSSWLALATKSARISSTRRIDVRSCSVMRTACRSAERNRRHERFEVALGRNPFGKFDALRPAARHSPRGRPRPIPACASAIDAGSPRRSAGASAAAPALKAITRPSRSSMITGSGRPEMMASMTAMVPCADASSSCAGAQASVKLTGAPAEPSGQSPYRHRRRHPPPTSRRLCRLSINSRTPKVASASANGVM